MSLHVPGIYTVPHFDIHFLLPDGVSALTSAVGGNKNVLSPWKLHAVSHFVYPKVATL